MDQEDMVELKVIVDRLNRDPFNMGLTLVAMHNKTPLEVHQVVNDIFAYLDPKMKKDLRDDQQEIYAQRMIEFALGSLGFKAPDDDVAGFTEDFIKGSHEVIYPLMFWMLDQKDILKKRAYLARFLKNMEIPEDMFADNTVVSLYQEHKDLQDKFKVVHQEVDAIRATALKPLELQNEIEQLSQEREQLTNKLTNLKDRVGADADEENFHEIRAITHKLRKEQEEESKIFQSLSEEKMKQIRAEQLYQNARAKLRHLEETEVARQDPKRVLQRLRDEVAKQRAHSNEKMAKNLHDRQRMLHELEDVMSADPLTEQQVNSLRMETDGLQEAVDRLTQTRDNLIATADGKIGFYRDRATAMEKKKEQLAEQLQELEEDRKEAENDLRQLEADLSSLAVGGSMPKSDSQMKAYMKELTKKTEVYKKKSKMLSTAKEEIGVLMRTEEVLRSRDGNITEFNEQLAAERGVSGYEQTQEGLENAAANKQSVDQTKGETLDEISGIVGNITQTLKARKNKLAPQIKELRSIRNKFEDVEADYVKKKKVYANMCLGLEGERLQLEQDVEENVTGLLEEESAFHFLNCLSQICQVRLDQMGHELTFQVGQDRLNPEFKSYREMYEKLINEEEKAAKALRQDKTSVKDSHGDNVQQRSMFLSMRKIMQCKAEMQKATLIVEEEQENNLVFGDGGGERLVID